MRLTRKKCGGLDISAAFCGETCSQTGDLKRQRETLSLTRVEKTQQRLRVDEVEDALSLLLSVYTYEPHQQL